MANSKSNNLIQIARFYTEMLQKKFTKNSFCSSINLKEQTQLTVFDYF